MMGLPVDDGAASPNTAQPQGTNCAPCTPDAVSRGAEGGSVHPDHVVVPPNTFKVVVPERAADQRRVTLDFEEDEEPREPPAKRAKGPYAKYDGKPITVAADDEDGLAVIQTFERDAEPFIHKEENVTNHKDYSTYHYWRCRCRKYGCRAIVKVMVRRDNGAREIYGSARRGVVILSFIGPSAPTGIGPGRRRGAAVHFFEMMRAAASRCAGRGGAAAPRGCR